MSQISRDDLSKTLFRGVFGAVAVSLTFGAAQLAMGLDLAKIQQEPTGTPDSAVNRTVKADRAAGVAGSTAPTRTISIRLDGLSDTSVLIRIPAVQEARNRPVAPSSLKASDRKMAVACEPVVSVLTEVARQLQPGRCVT